MGCGSSNPSDALTQQEQQRQDLIKQGTQQVNNIFGSFTPAFYSGIGQAYQNFALPQLAQQYQQTKNQLGYNLYGRGLQQSGAARKLSGSLENEYGNQKTNVANQALQQERNLQSQVANQKSAILGQLQSSADPTQASEQALGAASQFSAPSIFQPLGQAFNTWSGINLANQQNNLYNQFLQSYLGNSGGLGGGAGSLLPRNSY